MIAIILFSIVILLLFLSAYLYTTRNHSYWKKRKVKNDWPNPLFGNHFQNVFGFKSTTEISLELYKKYQNEKVVGYFRGTEPELLIRDLDIIRSILAVDFDHFYIRGNARNRQLEPLMSSLFFIEGDKWKLLRQRLTSAFTTAKLKGMFPLIVNCAKKLQDVGTGFAEKYEECDIRDMMARFAIEFIAACGLGIEVNTINTERSLFRDLGKAIFNRSKKYVLLLEMKYLRMAFREAMRKYPTLGILRRTCAKQYTIPGLKLTIDPGVRIQIPVQAIQMDEQYFDNPTEYRPERFDDKYERHNFSYLPFGEGPRACIAEKLGEMQSMAGLAAVLHKFWVEPSENSRPEPVVDHTANVVQGVKGGIPIKLKLRNKDL